MWKICSRGEEVTSHDAGYFSLRTKGRYSENEVNITDYHCKTELVTIHGLGKNVIKDERVLYLIWRNKTGVKHY